MSFQSGVRPNRAFGHARWPRSDTAYPIPCRARHGKGITGESLAIRRVDPGSIPKGREQAAIRHSIEQVGEGLAFAPKFGTA